MFYLIKLDKPQYNLQSRVYTLLPLLYTTFICFLFIKSNNLLFIQTPFSIFKQTSKNPARKMEQNLPIIAKKLLKIVKVLYFMLRKGISKGKLLADLSMLMKRGKIAGKAAIHSLMPHHRASTSDRRLEYEFNWAKTSSHKRKKQCRPTEEEMMKAAVEMFHSATASPALPGFGPSPMVRQLRITDSPFPLRNDEEDNRVDEAAEEFITRFYKDLRQQNSASYS